MKNMQKKTKESKYKISPPWAKQTYITSSLAFKQCDFNLDKKK